jgi:hypothetical protein
LDPSSSGTTRAEVEVARLSDLPHDLKSHFKGWLGERRENIAAPSETDDPGDFPGAFIIAGVSDSGALVAWGSMDMFRRRTRQRMFM